MISKDDCIHLGKITKEYGYKGEYLLSLKGVQSNDLENQESVFLEIDEILVPFFICSFKIRDQNKIVLGFDDIRTDARTKKIIGAQAYALTNDIPDQVSSDNEYDEFIGFSVYNEDAEKIGTIIDYMDIPGNMVFVVKTDEKEIMLPANEHTILELNSEAKMITMSIPDGLLDIY